MDYTDYKYFDSYLKKHLSAKRYKHSLGVSETAAELAKAYKLDVKKAKFAGLVHDIAKCYSIEETNRLIREYGVSPECLNNIALAHSKLGVEILKTDFGVTDPEILAGVSSHTTGRYDMSLFEEIIYVADAVEPGRDYPSATRLRKAAKKNIDKVCLELLEFTIKSVKERGSELDTETLGAYEYIKSKISTSEEK